MNDLDIDPKLLAYEFLRDWTVFKESKPFKFIVHFLQERLEKHQRNLETAEGGKVAALQGSIHEVRQILDKLKAQNIEPTLKQTVEYLERK